MSIGKSDPKEGKNQCLFYSIFLGIFNLGPGLKCELILHKKSIQLLKNFGMTACRYGLEHADCRGRHVVGSSYSNFMIKLN